MKCIVYNDGYKYPLKQDVNLTTSIKPQTAIDTQFIDMDTQGLLTIKSG